MRTSARRLRAWAGLAILCALVLAPPARAVDATGEFLADGAWEITGTPHAEFAPSGVFLADATSLDKIELKAATVEVVELRRVSAQGPLIDAAPRVDARSYVVTDANLTLLAPPEGGWLGVYASAVKATSDSVHVLGETRAAAAYGNGATMSEVAPDPSVRTYSVEVSDEHLLLEAAGKLVLTGDFSMKFEGPDVSLISIENTTRIRTGYAPPDFGAGLAEERWAFLRVSDARLELVARSPLLLPARAADIDWAGTLRLAPVSGALDAAGDTYLAEGESATLDGAFSGRFAPDGGTRTSLRIAGDMQATTLSRAAVPVAQAGLRAGWTLVGIAAIAATGVAGLAVARSRGRAAPMLGVDDYVRLAADAAEAEDFDAALGWTRKAIAHAPTSARLTTDEGYFLERLGETGPALAAYARAMPLSHDGEPEFLAFLLASRLALEDDAARWIVQALDKAPALLLGLEENQLAPLAHRAEVHEKIEWAKTRVASE